MDWKALVGFTIIFHGIVYAWKRSFILRLDTKKLNKCINGLSQHRIRKYLRIWFRLGTYVTILIGFPFTLWLFLRTIFYALAPSIVSPESSTIGIHILPFLFLLKIPRIETMRRFFGLGFPIYIYFCTCTCTVTHAWHSRGKFSGDNIDCFELEFLPGKEQTFCLSQPKYFLITQMTFTNYSITLFMVYRLIPERGASSFVVLLSCVYIFTTVVAKT
jgi:hypothetical protein